MEQEKTVGGEPETSLILEKGGFPFDKLDTLFKKLKHKMTDGYVLARCDDTERYLFMVGEKPYCAAVAGPGLSGVTPVKDFFTWYRECGRADVEIYKSDKKVMLCVLVRINFKAAQSFATDMVNLEDVVKRLESQGKSAVMALNLAGERGYAMFIGGRLIFAGLPGGGDTEGAPLDRLLGYSHNLPAEPPLAVDIFTDTKVAPAEDAPSAPPIDGEPGIATFYIMPTTEAYLEAYEDGKLIDRYPITDEDLTIGRETTNIVFLEAGGVSREQAVIKKKGDKYVITDLESANGTFFKGIRITEKELFDGDEINIMKYMLRFCRSAKSGEQGEKAEKQAHPVAAEELASEVIYPAAALEPDTGDAFGDDRMGAALIQKDGTVFPLGSITTLGKDKDSDIEVEGVLVAKRLATIIRGKDFFRIIKKGALSTLKVNDEKVNEHNLQDGDVIEVGGSVFRFRGKKGG